MVFGESILKDLYRKVVWGPYRKILGGVPEGRELWMNRGLGRVVAMASPGKRGQLRDNLALALGERSDLDALIAGIFATHFAEQYLSFSFSRIQASNAHRYLQIEGMEHLEATLAEDRGVVLLHPHMGPAQLPLCVLGHRGFPMNQVGGGGDESGLSATGKWAADTRHRLEASIPARIWDGTAYLRPVLRALERGEVVMSACDGSGDGQEMGRRLPREVCGQLVRIPVGGVYLALRSGAALLPLVTFYRPGEEADYVTQIGPPLDLDRSAALDDALEQGASLVAAELESQLLAHPADWHFWDEFQPGRFVVESS